MTSRDAIILYGRSDFIRRQALAPLIDGLAADTPGVSVELAYEDLSGPALPDVIDALAAKGVRMFCVLPCGVPADRSISQWLPGALSACRHGAGTDLDIRIAPPVEGFLDFAGAVRAALASDRWTDVATVRPSMGKPGWTDIPQHNLQVFFCLGARCAHRAGLPLYQHLRGLMKAERSLASGPRRVMCARSSCLFPCNQGPLMVVHPEGIWYGRLDRDLLARIVTEHFVGGRPVEEAIVHRQPSIVRPGQIAGLTP
ncbi:hypothetical protein [Paenirhodobacter sp.]|uniref:(2Fe-2S) ferredoxin domain-containing protein n=1 Tax=Paenirhodobacter sp. TaxID=1965326 RepID=UPI003B3D8A50